MRPPLTLLQERMLAVINAQLDNDVIEDREFILDELSAANLVDVKLFIQSFREEK